MRAVSWFPFGPDGGDAKAFAADPRDHAHLFLGAANGWIYQSRDGGQKWERLARVGKRDDLVIRHILVDPADSKHLVVGAYVVSDGGGIFISHDGGVTWTNQPEMRGQSVRSLTAAPSNPKILVAGTLEGVFRSTDGGEHWEQISHDPVQIHEVQSVAIDPVNPGIIYAGTWHLPWKTTDGGATWTSIKQGIIEDSDVFSIVIDPRQSNVVYLSACSGIYKSEDSGAKFTGGVGVNKTQGIPSTARRTLVLEQDPNKLDTVYAGTTEGLYETFDAGQHWIQTTGSDLIVNDVYVDPANSRRVLLATDRSGVLASEDGGSSFQPSNSGFSTRQIWAFTADEQHPATVYIGVVNDKDSGGVFVSHTGGLSWSHLSYGLDGHDVFSLGQAPDDTILAGTEHGIYRLKDSVWQRAGDDPSGRTPDGATPRTTRPVSRPAGRASERRRPATNPRSPSAATLKNFDGSVYGFARTGETLFAATSQGVLRSVSSGLTWSVVSTVPADDLRFVAASDETVAAASLNALEVSSDGGQTWQAVPLPEHVTQVSALAVDGRGGLWIGDKDGVYFSSGKPANWKTLSDLIVRKINSLFFDRQANRILITAGDPATDGYAVDIPSMRLTTWDTGWDLRFLRPVGDHLVAATLFDGIVVQPRWVDSPLPEKH